MTGAARTLYEENTASAAERCCSAARRAGGPRRRAPRSHPRHAVAAAASRLFLAPRPRNTDARNAGRATMASFAGSSKDTVADLLVDKSASPPPGAKPAKAPDTEKKHYSNNNDGETMEALLEGPSAASRRSLHSNASSPGEEVVGGLFVEFEAVRTTTMLRALHASRRWRTGSTRHAIAAATASLTLDTTQARPAKCSSKSRARADHDGAPEHCLSAVEQARHGHRARFSLSVGPDD